MTRALPLGRAPFRNPLSAPRHPSLDKLDGISGRFDQGPIMPITNARLQEVIQADVDMDAYTVQEVPGRIACLCASAVNSAVVVCLRGHNARWPVLAMGCFSPLLTPDDVRRGLSALILGLAQSGVEPAEAFVLGGCLQGCSTEACGSLDLCETVLRNGTEMGIVWTGVAVGLSQPTDFGPRAHLLPWTGRPESVTVVLTPSWVGYANDPQQGPELFDPVLITHRGNPFPMPERGGLATIRR